MIAQEMSDSGNRGRVLWLLASSRPDLIEVDLKRPGRVDVKVPLLPTSTPAESAQLIGALAEALRTRARARSDLQRLEPRMPTLLTPGAAEALVVKAYVTRAPERARAARRSKPAWSAIRIPCPPTCSNSRCASRSAKPPTCSFVPPRVPVDWQRNRTVMKTQSYLAAAFNARPLGMPMPPNWFGLAAFGLLGAFVNPASGSSAWASKASTCGGCRSNQRFRKRSMRKRGCHRQHARYDEPARAARLGARNRSNTTSKREAAEIVALLQRTRRP